MGKSVKKCVITHKNNPRRSVSKLGVWCRAAGFFHYPISVEGNMKKTLLLFLELSLLLILTNSCSAQNYITYYLTGGVFAGNGGSDPVNTITLQGSVNTIGGYVINLPPTIGLAGQALVTDGNNPANTSWANAGGSVGTIASASLGVNTNNYAPPACSLLRLNATADFELTGIVAGTDGQLLAIENVGIGHCSLMNNTTSTAANRFLMPGNFAIGPNSVATLEYNATQQRWKLLNTQ